MKKEQFLKTVEKMIEANKVSINKYGEFSESDWLSELGAWLHEEADETEKKNLELSMPDLA